MNFRLRADMYVVAPKVQLAHYKDNTMPRRDWSRYERSACERREYIRGLSGITRKLRELKL